MAPLDSATPSQRFILAAGTGFLGRDLARALIARHPECDVVVLTRLPKPQPTTPGSREVRWDGRTAQASWAREVDGAAAIFNLAGRTVDCRKTEENMRDIIESRVQSVQALHAAVAQANTPPTVWVQTGTAHIFGDSDTATFTDDSLPAPPASGMAPKVGAAWEHALFSVPTPATRKVNLRISFVLGPGGGALAKLATLARLGLGGTVGSGRQPMSWISLTDMTRLFITAAEDPTYEGTYNATSPQPELNRDFMRELRKAVHRPWSPPAPAWGVRLGCLLMNTDPELALYGRRVLPTKLLAKGFAFRFPSLRETLDYAIANRA